MQLFKDFSRVFGAPAFIEPYLHFFATEEEMRLVVALGDPWQVARGALFG